MIGPIVLLLSLVAAAREEERGISFSREIAPVLLARCLPCHGAEKAKGGYRVHTFEAVLQAGKSREPAVVPGKPDESELYKRLVTHDENDRMPQDDDPLPAGQIELFRKWIAERAKLDSGEPNSGLAKLIPTVRHPAAPEVYPRAQPVLAVAFTPDGGSLAVNGYHEVNIFSLKGELVRRIGNVPQRVHSIAFHPHGGRFALAGGKPGRSGEITVFDLKSGERSSLTQISDVMLTVAYSPNGKLLAGGGADNGIHVFDAESGEKITTIQQHADWVMSLQFDPCGTRVLSASRDRTARIYEALTGDLETTYNAHAAALFAAVFLPKETIASGGRDRAIHLWDAKEGKKRNEISGIGPDVYQLIATEDFLFAATREKEVRQYAIEDRKLVRSYPAANDSIYCMAFHSETKRLAAGSHDGTVRIWNSLDGALKSSFLASPLRADSLASGK